MQRKIQNVDFAEWVRQKPERGVIEPYVEGSWLWQIPEESRLTLIEPLAEADILFDPYKHFYPWMWTFARVWRGDLTRFDVVRLLLDHVRKHGTVPTPPHREQKSPNDPFITDETAVTRYLRELGHPAADLPAPPPPVALTPQQAIAGILGGPPKSSASKKKKT